MICKLYFSKAVKRKSSSSSDWLAVPLTFSSLCPLSPLTCLTAPFPGSRMECGLAELDSHFPHSLASWPGQVTPSLNFVFSSVRWGPKCLVCLSRGLLLGLIMVHWKVPYKMKAFGKMAKINNPRNKADALILKKKKKRKIWVTNPGRMVVCVVVVMIVTLAAFPDFQISCSVWHVAWTSWRSFYDKLDFDKW